MLTSEEKISVRKIDASRPMTDLDDEAQAKIAEMMYNEQQKRMGKPTSQEQVGFLCFVDISFIVQLEREGDGICWGGGWVQIYEDGF